ncbi:Nucleoid-associated protein YejK [bioreactor metagenome]|uniref:Nucleoid-associated protein YejK n=1 Tax=bioreactor metagenome TaxID=1076179 RepID=A0A644TMG9_9ZZZZ|nr:nucleoid-associated protein [Negativicutes bacterium]
MIIVNKAILHILDFNSGITVFSQQELEIKSDSVITFLTKHIERSYNDQNSKAGVFDPNSKFKRQVADYIDGRLEFVDFSIAIAGLMDSAISQADVLDSSDLLICDLVMDDNRLIAILKCNNRVGFTHQVIQDGDKVKNEIINHHAILPNLSQKIDEYAFVEVDSLTIKFIDKKRLVNGQETYVLPEKILECSSSVSPNSTIKLVNSITRKVAEKHGQSSVAAISKAKNYMVEHTETSEFLDPVEVGKTVFRSSPIMQEEYLEEVKKAGIAEVVKIDRDFCVKKGKNHKIKTDTGIEISFPVDYFENKEYMEFVNNSDGTISIELKNIGKIINR